jgi:hypothetical protein
MLTHHLASGATKKIGVARMTLEHHLFFDG